MKRCGVWGIIINVRGSLGVVVILEWYRLVIEGVRDGTFRKLLEKFENYEDIFSLDRYLLKKYCDLEESEVDKVYNSRNVDLKKELELLKNSGVGLIFLKDKEYPKELKEIAKPPIFLYYKGDISLLKKRKIAVVGTRRATMYGKIACEKIVRELVENEIVTVSGLALGIDGICHKKSLEFQGKTIAVVGSGLDIIYPKENEKIWREIEEKGLILSEYSLGTEPFSYNFPMRNRIIVGISQGVVVVESKDRGGSLITAELALEEGRGVFAVPGEIFSPASEGCNKLIKECSAKLITSIDDIFEEFNWKRKKVEEKNKLNLTECEESIYNILVREKSLDEIIQESSMKAGEILSILMDLEVKKIIVSVAGGKYRRKI